MFLTSFNVYFIFAYAYFMRICFETATWLFLVYLRQGLAFFGEDRLATLAKDWERHSHWAAEISGL